MGTHLCCITCAGGGEFKEKWGMASQCPMDPMVAWEMEDGEE